MRPVAMSAMDILFNDFSVLAEVMLVRLWLDRVVFSRAVLSVFPLRDIEERAATVAGVRRRRRGRGRRCMLLESWRVGYPTWEETRNRKKRKNRKALVLNRTCVYPGLGVEH
jgi:hypothetical protein